MILVVAGTRDGREIAAELAALGYPVLVSVVSEYGRQLSEQANLQVSACLLDGDGFADVAILAYSAKHASALYGPFRDAVDVTIAGGVSIRKKIAITDAAKGKVNITNGAYK